MRKLPLGIGLPVLVAALVAAERLDDPSLSTVAWAVVIGLAMWIAFSLTIRPRAEVEAEQDANTPALDDPDPHAPESLRPLTDAEQELLTHEAESQPPEKSARK